MNRAKSVHAIFGTTVNTTTPGNGFITKSPADGPYPFGSTVQVTATPANGYYFVLWGGAASGSVNPLNYTVSGATPTIMALFLQASSSQTISFGSLASKVLGDAPFALNASASSGLPVSYSILSGPATVMGNTLTITGGGTVVVRALQSGNAEFSAAPNVDQIFTVHLTLTNAVLGIGTVTRDPDLAQYTYGAVVLLTATPGSQAVFTGWSGGASGTTNPLPVLMDTNKNITASFSSTNNPSSPPVFSLSSSSYSVVESDTSVVITVWKSANSLGGVVNYATADGSAHASSGGLGHYQAASGTLNFLVSDISKAVTIPILDDPVYTGSRQFAFNLTLANLSDGSSLTNPGTATITITDDEPPATTNSHLFHGNPGSVPAHSGQLRVSLEPPAANGQWRLAWETAWRNSGDLVGGLPSGNYEVTFKPVPGFIQPPNTTNPVSGSLYAVTNSYLQSGDLLAGSLSVNLAPSDANGQWRVQGETNWHSSGEIVANLGTGYQIVEFKSVAGYTTPAKRQVIIGANQINLISTTYLVENPSGSTLPSLLQFNDVTQPLSDQPPYPWCGQLLADVGYGSGCVVKRRVVLTAAHVVFNDASLSFVIGVNWFFQRYQSPGTADDYEPPPQVPRGWYVLGGYAAARTNDNSPGVSSPVSQNLDIAALFFLEDAGRGGFSGYLVSNPGSTEWLQAASPKTLIGYPVEGAGIFPGRTYATTPGNRNFTPAVDHVFSTTDILGYPGMSGGPLCVQFSTNVSSTYFPAGIFLGGSGQTIVRAIDGAAADLINRAEITSYTGDNNTGGGVITIIPSQNISANNPGYVQVQLTPPAALKAGAAWRLQGDGVYSSATNFTRPVTSTNSFAVEFKSISGWNSPSNQTVTVSPGQLTQYTAFYTVTNPVVVNNPALGIGVTGTTGTVYRLERKSSLSDPTWLPVSTNTISSNGFNLVLPYPPTNPPIGFYRLRWLGQ